MFSQINGEVLETINVVAADIDGTITEHGHITDRTLTALEKLNAAGIRTLLITGRSAGFGLGLMTYLPGLDGLIAENGGVVIADEKIVWSRPRSARLSRVFDLVRERFPHLDEGNDNFARLSDFTIDMRSVGNGDLERVRQLLSEHQVKSTYSTIHLHIFDADDSKGRALRKWLNDRGLAEQEVLTIGDSINDESLFESPHFLHSCWVGARECLQELENQPAYLTHDAEGAGFQEIANALLSARGRKGVRIIFPAPCGDGHGGAG
jgi:hypothetical protein